MNVQAPSSQEEESIPWRDALTGSKSLLDSAVYLRGIRHREGLTQKELAARLDISVPKLSAMENGRRNIGKAMAIKVAEVLGCDWRQLL